jgi:hypothetical protein
MINKIYKIIHNKYSPLFKFIFFLRYLFGIFFISIVLFLSIPHFFDYTKKEKALKNYLLESYDLSLNNYEKINYNLLPTPNLEIKNVNLSLKDNSIEINIEKLNIYPKLLNIYNYENFSSKKIIFSKNKMFISDLDLKIFIKYIYNLKKKLTFKNLDLKIGRKDSPIINLQKIKFSNYGYNKNIIRGEIFDKEFKISLNDNYNKINFKLLKTGIIADVNLNEVKKDSIKSGELKSKLFNSKLKLNFDYGEKKIKIYNSYFRNKDLSFNNESIIIYYPFFSINSIFKIDDINLQLLKKININKILSSKDFIKKINIINNIEFNSKTFNRKLIDSLNLNIDLAYGRLVYSKKILISENIFTCNGDINLLEEYPILYFDCSTMIVDKKKFFKKFSIKYKIKNESFILKTQGNINILNNKINFKNIKTNQNYTATKEDLNYYKQSFETILFDRDFLSIFNFKKMKEFILEIS